MLRRELGLLELTLAGLGIIVGVGIYTLIGEAAGIIGNGIWLAFLVSSFLAFFTAMSYVELSYLFPKAGAEYVYVKNSFGESFGFLVGSTIFIGSCLASATVSMGFANYLSELINIPPIYLAVGLIILCSILNVCGIKESIKITIVISLISILGLILVIIIGLQSFGSVNYFEISDIKSIFRASAIVFFAFLGFGSIARLSEESKKKEFIQKAIIISLIIATLIYILVCVSAVSVVNWKILSESKSPLAEVVKVKLGENASIVISIMAIFATSSTVLMNLVSISRLLYGMKDIFPPLGKIGERRTPYLSAIVACIISVVFTMIYKDIGDLAGATDFTVFINFIAINLAVIYFRKKKIIKKKFTPEILGLPIFPILGIVSSFLFILGLKYDIIFNGILLLLFLFVFYRIWKKIK